MRVMVPCPACGRERFASYPSVERAKRNQLCHPCAMKRIRDTNRAANPPPERGPRGGQERAEALLEEIHWINAGPEQTARRLGTTVTAIARRLHRWGFHEEARPFDRARTRAPIPLEDNDPRHGTHNGYTHCQCRCQECGAAWLQYRLALKERDRKRAAA